MIRSMVVIAVLLLSGCSSQPQKAYYQLPSLVTKFTDSKQSKGSVFVERITVADILNYDGIVVQTDDVQYVLAANNLWISPLNKQLKEALIENLSQSLPDWLISDQKIEYPGDYVILDVKVTRFNSRYDGKAVIKGEWVITKYHSQNAATNHITHKAFNIVLPLDEDGYPALIRTLAQGWQQESVNIANSIR